MINQRLKSILAAEPTNPIRDKSIVLREQINKARIEVINSEVDTIKKRIKRDKLRAQLVDYDLEKAEGEKTRRDLKKTREEIEARLEFWDLRVKQLSRALHDVN